ncbi:trypsin alpha-like [Bactrocera oleae]|uniref:trypsin alpha-like n=1 Tax=Bactrocera oleae TaxID=104688 RepID=UPI00174E994C|nr:trypsin alpha-like [Bactrocera oleae]
MLKFVVVLSFVACALAGTIPEGMVRLSDDLSGRIVGGTPTTISSFPWQISLQRSGSHSCGGSIYSSNIIVTAAHCLQSVSASILRIRSGSTYWNSGGVLVSVSTFKTHEGYIASTYSNDIAIIKLASSLSFSSTTRAIGLATITPPSGASAVVSGWGTLSSGSRSIPRQLQYVGVDIIDRSRCASSSFRYGSEVKPGMVCAAAIGKDACQGDSGGPLVSGGVLVGVVSWGYGCAAARYPGVYTDVPTYHSWIVEKANSI